MTERELEERIDIDKAINKLRSYPYNSAISRFDKGFVGIGQYLERLLRPLVGDIKNKRILDIGCGNTKKRDMFSGEGYEPWNARFFSLLGADVIGIDFDKADGEIYKHIQADLTKTPIREAVGKDRKFDIAIASFFFISPTLHQLVGLYQNSFNESIFKQVYDILDDNGVFIVSPNLYGLSKTENAIKCMESIGFLKKDVSIENKEGIYLKEKGVKLK